MISAADVRSGGSFGVTMKVRPLPPKKRLRTSSTYLSLIGILFTSRVRGQVKSCRFDWRLIAVQVEKRNIITTTSCYKANLIPSGRVFSAGNDGRRG